MANQSPGIIIQELASSSLAIQQSATAVPVFIGRFISAGEVDYPGKCIKVNSWLEFTRLYLEPTSFSLPVYSSFAEHATTYNIARSNNDALRDVTSPEVFISAASATPCEPGEDLVFTVTLSKPATLSDDVLYSTAIENAGESSAIAKEDFTNEWLYYTDLNPTRKKAPRHNDAWNIVDVVTGTSIVYFVIPTLLNSAYAGVNPYLNIKFAISGDTDNDVLTKTARGDIVYPPVQLNTKMCGYYALYYYFLNGGGTCYILQLTEGDEDGVARLPGVIVEYSDITLMVCTETDESLRELYASCDKNAVYSALTPLLTPDKGYFLIADAEENGTAPPSLENSDCSAVYYPNVATAFKRTRPLDESVSILGYEGVENLHELSTKNPSVYDVVNKRFEQILDEDLILPPSALVAGVYASTDRERGVWKAPANIVLKGVKALEAMVTPTEHGSFNEAGINVIRWFSLRGPVIYGARTLSVDSLEWRYISVRRLFNSVERDTKAALRVLLFEPNNEMTWERARSSIYNYLAALWQEGGLVGSKPSEAFFVHVGLGITMNKAQLEEGMLIVEIGMAVVRPAEFIILKFTQNQQ